MSPSNKPEPNVPLSHRFMPRSPHPPQCTYSWVSKSYFLLSWGWGGLEQWHPMTSLAHASKPPNGTFKSDCSRTGANYWPLLPPHIYYSYLPFPTKLGIGHKSSSFTTIAAPSVCIDYAENTSDPCSKVFTIQCMIQKYSSGTTILRDWHWLPISFRVQFKVPVLTWFGTWIFAAPPLPIVILPRFWGPLERPCWPCLQ